MNLRVQWPMFWLSLILCTHIYLRIQYRGNVQDSIYVVISTPLALVEYSQKGVWQLEARSSCRPNT